MHDVFQSLFTDAFKHTDIQLFNGVTFILDNCYEERFVDFLNQAEEVLNHLEKVKTAKLSKAEMELLNERIKKDYE
ncbi:hypothetical protein JCM19233_6195 [Vibrio astriarenae]|nr:hypothetical protein JCM19233_6195 [Vibrio sp. C7]